jgi:ferrous-iron efflux pump FieF
MVQHKAKPALRAGIMTIAIASFLVALKGFAFIVTGSLAVLSSLIDSVLDVNISVVNYLAIRYSAKPADEEHRYGHGKIEGLAALLQASMIGGAAVFLIFEVLSRLIAPQSMQAHITAIVVMIISAFASLVIVMIQNRALERSGSLAVESDRAHYTSDIIMHAGVIVAVLIQFYKGPAWIDAAFAAIVVLWMANTAREIASKGLDMILDRELPREQRERLLALINNHAGVLGVHDLRTTRSGMKEIITFDIEADPQLSLHDAHAITKDLEREILEIFPEAEIMIHVDPHGEIEDSRHKVASVHH